MGNFKIKYNSLYDRLCKVCSNLQQNSNGWTSFRKKIKHDSLYDRICKICPELKQKSNGWKSFKKKRKIMLLNYHMCTKKIYMVSNVNCIQCFKSHYVTCCNKAYNSYIHTCINHRKKPLNLDDKTASNFKILCRDVIYNIIDFVDTVTMPSLLIVNKSFRRMIICKYKITVPINNCQQCLHNKMSRLIDNYKDLYDDKRINMQLVMFNLIAKCINMKYTNNLSYIKLLSVAIMKIEKNLDDDNICIYRINHILRYYYYLLTK